MVLLKSGTDHPPLKLRHGLGKAQVKIDISTTVPFATAFGLAKARFYVKVWQAGHRNFVGLLKNGRLVLVFILFGLSRARADMGTLEGWLREKGVLPPRKKEEAPTEDDTAADAMFPPMY